MEDLLSLIADFLDWRGKRNAKKEGRKYGITIQQYVTIYLIIAGIIIGACIAAYDTYIK